MRNLCHVFSIVVFALCFGATSARAQLKWDQPNGFVAASPDEGKAVTHFPFVNAGKYPVKITGTKTSCGCTAAVVDQRVFAPGEKGAVEVTFKTINRNGLYEEPVIVKTDDPSAPESTLKLRVLVRDVLDVQPTLVFWRADEPLTPKTIRVKVTEGFAVKQLDVSASDPNVAVRVETIKAGSEYGVVVTPKTQRLKATLSIRPEYPANGEPKTFTAHVRAG